MKPTYRNSKQAQSISGLESRYRRAIASMRACKTNKDTKALEFDIAHTINKIDQYGFEFFPNHFIRNDVIRLEAMINQLHFATTNT